MELIPSKDVRAYLDSLGWKFSDQDRATMILNLRMPESDICLELDKIMKETEDQKLKTKLQSRKKHKEATLEALKKIKCPCVYLVTHYNEDEEIEEDGLFATFELAKQFGDSQHVEYVIEKKRILDAELKEGYLETDLGYVCYSEDGKIWSLSSYEVEYDEEEDDEDEDENGRSLEDRYVVIPHPFQYGDIVRDIRDGTCGVIYTAKGGWEAEDEWFRELNQDYSCSVLNVEMFYEDSCSVGHDHIKSVYLEFANLTEDDDQYEVLQMIQALMMGEGTLDSFNFALELYMARKDKCKVVLDYKYRPKK
ncbi:MAG: hypothetical protein IJ374_07205 [Lachnospiraceae bacterium]|nr:hypothetical protein [Lachnospiraceae bacterium]